MKKQVKTSKATPGVDLLKILEGSELKPNLPVFGRKVTLQPLMPGNRTQQAQQKVEQLLQLQQLTDQSIQSTIRLFADSFPSLNRETTDFLEKKLLDFSKNVFKGQRMEFERQTGKHSKLRQLYVQDYDAMVMYTYLPPTADEPYLANGDPGYPGDAEEIELWHIYVDGVDVLEVLPQHCRTDLEETCLQEEHDFRDRAN
jgi:hypothetical protein